MRVRRSIAPSKVCAGLGAIVLGVLSVGLRLLGGATESPCLSPSMTEGGKVFCQAAIPTAFAAEKPAPTPGSGARQTIGNSDTAAPEQLAEMFRRKARRATAVWGAKYLEDRTTFCWQPETVMYRDVKTGHEVWRLSNTPLLNNYYHNDIGVSPWSADGSKLAFTAWDRYTQAYSQTQQREFRLIWMTVDTNGQYLRPVVEGPQRDAGGYFHWSPQIPNVYYATGSARYYSAQRAPDPGTLYKARVAKSGTVVTVPLIRNAPRGGFNKLISADGKRAIIYQWKGETVPVTLYPLKLWPDNEAAVLVPRGYSVDRHFGLYGDTPDTVIRYHDNYMAGDGSWLFVMPSGSATWWRMKTLGSAADGGPLYTGDDGNHAFGDIWPEDHGTVTAGHIGSPFVQENPYSPDKTSYWSHFVPDRWGRYALFSDVADNLPGAPGYQNYGPGVWDILNHKWVVPTFGGGAQHHDWHGFTDWTISSGGPLDKATGRAGNLILAQVFDDPKSQFVVNSTHVRYDGGTDYFTLPRPGQSPDGTKVAWHSEFLNGKNKSDIFWSAVFNPHPPTDLEIGAGSYRKVKVSFLPPKYTERRWINPTTGAIDEIHGEELYAREIKNYHVWRSKNRGTGWDIVGTVPADYGNDPVTNTLKPKANGNWVSRTNKIASADNPGDGTWYYAITSEEHSGLESNEFSGIILVTISEGRVITTRTVENKGRTKFWTKAPLAPQRLRVLKGETAGHFRLDWVEPRDEKARLYNIYYSAHGKPEARQEYRIASLAAGISTYLDWLADPRGSGFYGMTTVDRYGNESSVTYAALGAKSPSQGRQGTQ